MTNSLRKIGVFGSFGFNRGDDAIALSIIEGVRKLRPDMKFIVPIQREGVFADVPNVKTFMLNRRSIKGMLCLLNAIRSTDAVILGAGSMVQDKFGAGYIRGILGYGWTLSLFCRLLRKPTVTGPIGVDALKEEKSKRIAKQFLERLGRIYVRDPKSKDVALGILGSDTKKSIEVVCDPVFYWEPEWGGEKENYVVLSPAFEGQNEDVILNIFTTIAEEIGQQDENVRFKIVAMDERDKEDAGKISLIFDALSPELQRRTDLCKPATPQEATDILRNGKGVVAMRLHSLIIGYGYTRLFCLSRTTKTEALMDTYHVPGAHMADIAYYQTMAKQAATAILEFDAALEQDHKTKLATLEDKLKEYYNGALSYLEATAAR